MRSVDRHTSEAESYLTLRQAAQALNVPYFKIQRAARLGIVPVYRLLNSRPYVKRSDLERVMSGNCSL
ncbi:hypothetical protein MCBMB27_03692 [Methylobacterium phyllosphaerae]|uniref:Helix-turn-helix domain-containing protein n=1 Tax=Methylobacterium phyllosphaerae TaxID=418223 RepID=A0AAE8HUV3_9HYPH|nr:hypothetical protein MCBMB27_03692 [Methylobacterium phyllosphaerae]SFH30218.1 hypothetical protein SAMN05192567_119116 [Methylobacterium phyllosphaerae]